MQSFIVEKGTFLFSACIFSCLPAPTKESAPLKDIGFGLQGQRQVTNEDEHKTTCSFAMSSPPAGASSWWLIGRLVSSGRRLVGRVRARERRVTDAVPSGHVCRWGHPLKGPLSRGTLSCCKDSAIGEGAILRRRIGRIERELQMNGLTRRSL